MRDTFLRIKRLVMQRRVIFTIKAQNEMETHSLNREDVYESIWGAPGVYKKLRSRNPKTGRREQLYIIHGLTLDGIGVYTKGKIVKSGVEEVFYVLISSKKLD